MEHPRSRLEKANAMSSSFSVSICPEHGQFFSPHGGRRQTHSITGIIREKQDDYPYFRDYGRDALMLNHLRTTIYRSLLFTMQLFDLSNFRNPRFIGLAGNVLVRLDPLP
jgi:hypothetical protein